MYRFSWVSLSVYFRNFIIICKLLFLVNQISRWISARCLPSNLWFLHFGSPADSYSVYELKRLQWRYDAKPNMIARSRLYSWWSVVGLCTALNDLNGHQTTTNKRNKSFQTYYMQLEKKTSLPADITLWKQHSSASNEYLYNCYFNCKVGVSSSTIFLILKVRC